ncbi:MAG: hypothetical protein NVS4B6_11530 [Mycobacterium sp.]
MKIRNIPLVLLRFQYQFARLPFQLIEQRLADRLEVDAPPRLFYERSLGALDTIIGQLLGDSELRKRGTALVARSDALSEAARLDADADRKREQADAEFAATQKDVVTDIQEARDATEQQVVEARLDANKHKKAAQQTAKKRAAAVKKRVAETAVERATAVEAAARQEKAKARKAEHGAATAAAAKRRDSQAKRTQAARTRAQADRIADAVEAEKRDRRSARADNSSK